MNYSYDETTLVRVRDLAAIGTALADVAIHLQVDYHLLVADYLAPDSPLKIYYDTGIRQGTEALNQKRSDLARGGSLQAAAEYAETLAIAQRKDFLKQLREL